MKCPKCRFEVPEGLKFCGECGTKLEQICPQCDFPNPPNFKFCGECGHDLRRSQESPPAGETESIPSPDTPQTGQIPVPPVHTDGERKHVTALFSDMSGYTAMSEKLDPEEIKEITGRIFGEISKIVDRYEGFIEKFIGDAVMALFGVPQTHEDDPVRAIKAALEIHEVVRAMSPQVEERIGSPLSMHTGVNTGLVVTGEVDVEKGTHGVAGDTINVAARLSSLAEKDTVLVGPDTYLHSKGFFEFDPLEPVKVKGKTDPIPIYRVQSFRERPSTTPRHRGLRADLIGREMELAQLGEAVERLKGGKGSIFFVCGDTGTGKTRLVEELRSTLDPEGIQWLDGQAYAYSQNTPYYPLIDLFNRSLGIKDEDPRERVQEKFETGTGFLIDGREDVIPYLGSLYSLNYPEIEGVSPEIWRSRLQAAVHEILSVMTLRAPTIICLEDLHWADPSFLGLLRFLLSKYRYAALFLCIYRPPFTLFSGQQLGGLGMPYQEIYLQDLSPSETQAMLDSLLGSGDIPQEVRKFVRENVGGNPFYLEEVINAFIHSGTLKRDNGAWVLSKPITASDMPSTIQGVISARLDHLEKAAKKILQEASVIGRTFLYDILRRCTLMQGHFDQHLTRLERLDLIHARSVQPDLEYIFKSALTHDVVYNGLLKKERREIHERIGTVMEQLFRNRLPEFYETLAFHFKQASSIHKAVNYLVHAGEKCLARYAVEESHQYFMEAFDLLRKIPEKTAEEENLLIDLLNRWSLVFYYRGDFKQQLVLLNDHKDLAESLEDRARLGMFYAWLGHTLWENGEFRDSYDYLCRAVQLGEETGDHRVIGYACAWLTWSCCQLGSFDEGIRFGERALEKARLFPADHYLYFKSLGGIAFICSVTGDKKRALEAGNAIVDYGRKYANARSMTLGHYVMGFTHFYGGEFQSAAECSRKALQIAADPFYSQLSRFLLGLALANMSEMEEAEEALRDAFTYSQQCGCQVIGIPASGMLGMITLVKGRMTDGLRRLEDCVSQYRARQGRFGIVIFEFALGRVFLEIVAKTAPVSFSTLAKNLGFVFKNVPSAAKRAEEHLGTAVEEGKEIGADTQAGAAMLHLGLLHKARGKDDRARECLIESIRILERCGSDGFLKQAGEALASLG